MNKVNNSSNYKSHINSINNILSEEMDKITKEIHFENVKAQQEAKEIPMDEMRVSNIQDWNASGDL
jgi:hypothetical protein